MTDVGNAPAGENEPTEPHLEQPQDAQGEGTGPASAPAPPLASGEQGPPSAHLASGEQGSPSTLTAGSAGGGRSPRRLSERLLPAVTGSLAVIPLIGLVLMVVVLLLEAFPSIRLEGIHFITSGTWTIGNTYGNPVTTGGVLHPPGASYGALYLIIGTLEASAIAVVIGFPVAIGCAVIVVEKLPRALSSVVGVALEMLAGIPSVIYGLWGFLVLGPFLVHHIYPTLAKLPNVPGLNIFRGNIEAEGLLTTGIVLAVMIIPIIAATTRDLLRQVPETTKEGTAALGMTDAEGFRVVQYRWVRTGVIAAGVLGLGRALGETIAVAMVSGAEIALSPNIYGAMTTIAATIVTQLDAALADPTNFAVKALAEAALALMVITLIANVGARLLVRRVSASTALPVGAGF